jgi:hypothetical protein
MYQNTFPEPISPASVQYNDAVGTAAADRADALVGAKSLEELIGLSGTSWTIVGYHIYRSVNSWSFHFYAANTAELGINAHEDFASVERKLGHIPVRDFSLPHGVDSEEVFTALFKRFSVTMIHRGLKDYQLSVTEGDDLPFGDIPAES